ncbi:MAG: type 4a pilus biogenesis protein PilO [Fibromonadaceae bacterium]|jgi:type IV pilus assembly protein PilO|nr:type 4a pilus biogenesis protein PilO [Fibromonadaceae bacterium]
MADVKFDLKDKKNIYVLVVAVVCLTSVYMFYDSIWTEFEDNQKRLIEEQKNSQAELDKLNLQRSRVPQLEAELQKAKIEFERLKEMFPEEEKVPLRLNDLYSVVRTSGVNIQEFKPNGQVEQEHFMENKYFFNVNAGYHMLGYMFAEIANFKYPTTIDNLKLNRFGSISQEVKKAEEHGWEPVTMSVSFDLTTFTSRKK